MTPRRALRAASAALSVLTVVSCSTTETGTAVKAADDGGAVVALMDTGGYATAAGPPFGAAGDDVAKQNVMEAHRLAEYTVGPWEVDRALTALPSALEAARVAPIITVEDLRRGQIIPAPLIDIAAARGVLGGFTTLRIAPAATGQQRSLQTVILRFATPEDAAGAAADMVSAVPPELGVPPGPPQPVANNPDVTALTFKLPDASTRVIGISARAQFLVFQSARVEDGFLGTTADLLVDGASTKQANRLDQFSPTAPDKLAALPMDPTGSLLARTLWSLDGSGPVMYGVWSPQAWLHFELDPIATAALFKTAGVDAVSQRLTTVYQAGNADGATRLADGLTEQIAALPHVAKTAGVQGLPSATCFKSADGLPATSPMSWQRTQWVAKCVGHVDRYTYTAFSADPGDARRQMAAQYRILAGE